MVKERFNRELILGDLVIVDAHSRDTNYGLIVGSNQVFVRGINKYQTVYKLIGEGESIVSVIKLGQDECYMSMIKQLHEKFLEVFNRELDGHITKLKVGDVLESSLLSQNYIVYMGKDTHYRNVFLNFTKPMKHNNVYSNVSNKTEVRSISSIVRSLDRGSFGIDDYRKLVYFKLPPQFSLYTGHINIIEDMKEFIVKGKNSETKVKLK